jgi:hypothetical protein
VVDDVYYVVCGFLPLKQINHLFVLEFKSKRASLIVSSAVSLLLNTFKIVSFASSSE